jgi:O-succinylbenzoic acid--CoA ligase
MQPGFVLDAVLDAADAERITMLSLVPTALARVAERRAPASLRVALIGGAAASRDLLATAAAHGWPVAPTYGCTEAASQVATAVPGSAHALAGNVGVPLGPTRVRVVDARGRALPAGVDGTIEIAGPTVALGVARADGGVDRLARRGWLPTNDLGRLAPDGALTVLGRRDDVIVTGGENVAPTEVENALAALPGVAEVAVAGVPDATWGRAVAAWVVPQPGATVALDDLRAAARARLAPHKLPKRLYVVDALPRTAAGKVRRSALRPTS